VAKDDMGNFVVVWSGSGEGDESGVFLRRYAGGVPKDQPIAVSSGSAAHPTADGSESETSDDGELSLEVLSEDALGAVFESIGRSEPNQLSETLADPASGLFDELDEVQFEPELIVDLSAL
jgi:hypothetical protein